MSGTYTVNGDRLTGLTVYSTLPVGTIILYGGSVIPVGFLICNGDAISRTDYADLFSKIGTTYGAGDGSTTFNIPNKTEVGYTVIIKAVDYVSLPQNAIDDTVTTTGNAWSASKTSQEIADAKKVNYSTEEKVIGTWIDGKPIYQKSYHLATVTSEAIIDPTITNAMNIINCYGACFINGEVWLKPFPYGSANGVVAPKFTASGMAITAYWTTVNLNFTIEYTKTTD